MKEQKPKQGGVREGSTAPRYAGLLHMVDFLPTLVSLAGGAAPSSLDGVEQWPLDGINQWPALSRGLPSPRSVVGI